MTNDEFIKFFEKSLYEGIWTGFKFIAPYLAIALGIFILRVLLTRYLKKRKANKKDRP